MRKHIDRKQNLDLVLLITYSLPRGREGKTKVKVWREDEELSQDQQMWKISLSQKN
jgi:hypothetical protein